MQLPHIQIQVSGLASHVCWSAAKCLDGLRPTDLLRLPSLQERSARHLPPTACGARAPVEASLRCPPKEHTLDIHARTCGGHYSPALVPLGKRQSPYPAAVSLES